MPVFRRDASEAETSASGRGPALSACSGRRNVRATFLPLASAVTFDSTMVFQASQTGHRPTHLAARCPQAWQTNSILAFDIGAA